MAMMKGIRRLVWWLLVLVVVAVGAVVLLAQTVDPNEYKPRIEKLVADKTGRDINLEGELQMTLFPWVGVETGRVQLANAEGFGDDPMLEVDNARVKVKLLPLIKREVEVDTVILDAPIIRLATDAQGVNNWDDLTAGEPAAAQQDNPAGGLAALVVEGVSIDNGTVHWQNRQTDQSLIINSLNLETGRLVPGEPLDISLSMDGEGSMLPEPASVALETTLTVNEELDNVDLVSTSFDLNAQTISATAGVGAFAFALTPQQLSASDVDATLTRDGRESRVEFADLRADLTSLSVNLPRAVITSGDDRLELIVQGQNLAESGRSMDGDFTFSVADLSALLGEFGLQDLLAGYPDTRLTNLNGGGSVQLDGDQLSGQDIRLEAEVNDLPTTISLPALEYSLDTEALAIPGLSVTQTDFTGKVSVSGKGILSEGENRSIDGDLGLQIADLPELLARNGNNVELPDGVVTAVSAESEISLKNNNLDLNGLNAQVDDTNISGSLGLHNLENPAYRFDLLVDQLDLDQLGGNSEEQAVEEGTPKPDESASQTGTAQAEVQGGQAETAEQVALPAGPVQGLNADGRLRVGRLVTSGITLTEVDTTLKSADNVLRLEPLKANLFGGSLDSTIQYDVSDAVPAIQIRNTTSDVKVGELLSALKVTDRIEGRGTLNADLRGQGANTDDLMASMSGDIGTRMQDGAIKGYDLQKALLAIEDQINAFKGGESTATTEHGAETKFAELSATFKATNGVFTNDDLDMKAPLFRVNGGGQIGLPNNRIDYKLSVNVVDSVEGQGGAALDELKGQKIPLKIYGPLNDPSITLDLASLAKEELKKEVEKQLLEELGVGSGAAEGEASDPGQVTEEPEESLEDQLKKKAGEELLKGLGF